MKRFVLSLIFLSSISVSASFAKDLKESADMSALSPEESTQQILKMNDLDKDGKLSKKEVNIKFRYYGFPAADKDKDGFLTEEELMKMYEKNKSYQEQKAQD